MIQTHRQQQTAHNRSRLFVQNNNKEIIACGMRQQERERQTIQFDAIWWSSVCCVYVDRNHQNDMIKSIQIYLYTHELIFQFRAINVSACSNYSFRCFYHFCVRFERTSTSTNLFSAGARCYFLGGTTPDREKKKQTQRGEWMAATTIQCEMENSFLLISQ